MSAAKTVAGAQEYWRRYYAEQFRFGLGTEDILATLMQIPPVDSWVDLGCGSESMLWAIALRARRLVAVDGEVELSTLLAAAGLVVEVSEVFADTYYLKFGFLVDLSTKCHVERFAGINLAAG